MKCDMVADVSLLAELKLHLDEWGYKHLAPNRANGLRLCDPQEKQTVSTRSRTHDHDFRVDGQSLRVVNPHTN